MPRGLQLTMSAWLTGLAFSGTLVTAQPPVPAVSPADLATQLRQIESELDANPRSQPALPDLWHVATSEGSYSIPTQPLRTLLGAGRISPARRWVDEMAAQLDTYSKTPAESTSTARDSLTKILARREFSDVHPPSPWELFRDRIFARLASFLQDLLAVAGQHSAGGQVLFWVLIAAAIGLLAMWLIRLWTRGDPMLVLSHLAPRVAARNSENWLRDARQAAASSQWREAIHCAYWAAIARLQESRTLPEDRTRTPREYLRLIRAEQPASSPLRALTLGLERFWYAKQTAGAGDFEELLKHLESLGCKVE